VRRRLSALLRNLGTPVLAAPNPKTVRHTPFLLAQALKLLKTDLEDTRKQRVALEVEVETKDAAISALQSKVGEDHDMIHMKQLLVN